MPRPIIFTPTALARIARLVEQGLSAAAIADEIGCTLGSLRVRCSQMGISLRSGGLEKRPKLAGPEELPPGLAVCTARGESQGVEQLYICLPQFIVEQLRQRATLVNLTAAELAAELLATITRDNLYEAVLDDN